jgi:hypothetical protein
MFILRNFQIIVGKDKLRANAPTATVTSVASNKHDNKTDSR